MPITITPELEALLRSRAEAAGVAVEAYLERIARDEQAAEAELEALAVEGLNSGDSLEASPTYWERKRQRLVDRHRKPSGNAGAASNGRQFRAASRLQPAWFE